MAGYMKKLNGYMFTGEMTSASELENGMLVKVASGKLVKAVKTTDFTLTKIEDEDVLGVTGARYRVEALAAPVFFVQNEIEINDSEAYDAAAFKIAAGKPVKAHPLQVGEEFASSIAGLV